MPNVTSNPKRDTIDGTQRKTRRGNRSRFSKTDRRSRTSQAVESVTEVLTYRVVGSHTARNDLGHGFAVRHPELPTIEITKSRKVLRSGKRRHKAAQTLHRNGGSCTIAPIWAGAGALEAIRKMQRLNKDDGEATNVRIKGQDGVKNKHTISAPKVDMTQRAAEVVDMTPELWKLKKLRLIQIGRTKWYDATVTVSNGKWSRSIILRRVKDERSAIRALREVHNIE